MLLPDEQLLLRNRGLKARDDLGNPLKLPQQAGENIFLRNPFLEGDPDDSLKLQQRAFVIDNELSASHYGCGYHQESSHLL
ncbi:Uncharacterised protein [Chlamydia abortus]|nr:Uncharacterised protein [Chlamydia abortus]